MPKLNEVFELLPNFSPAELKQIKRRLDFMLQDPSNNADSRTEGTWLGTGMILELERRSLLMPGQSIPKEYAPKLREVSSFLLTRSRRILSEQEKYNVGIIVARALADYL